MSLGKTFLVFALGIGVWIPGLTVAQEFRHGDFLERNMFQQPGGAPYNPVTRSPMTAPSSALAHNRGQYTLTSVGQEPPLPSDSPENVQGNLLSGPGVDSYDGCDACCAPCCCWTFLAESIWLDRSSPDPFGVSFPGSDAPSILNTNQLNFNQQPGYRLTLAKVCGCVGWEVSYFNVQSWHETANVVDPNRGLDSFLRVGVPDVANFRNAFSQTLTGDTNLHSFEANRRWFLMNDGPWVASVILGFRYFHLGDHLRFLSNDVDPQVDPTDIGLYSVSTNNNLVGGQIGGSLLRRVSDSFSVGGKLKAGLFANFAEQNSHLLNQQPGVPPSTDLSSHAAKTQFSSVIETGAFGTWQLTQNFGFRGGYDVFIFSGLALASNQLDFTANTFRSQPFVISTSTLVAHGPNVGVWYTW